MPYASIWAGFVFQPSNNARLTRITNGIIEKFWQYRKFKFTPSVYPANYVNMTIDSNIGQATKFQDSLDPNQMSEEDSSDSESDKNEISDVSDNDYENFKKVDVWAKKTKFSK